MFEYENETIQKPTVVPAKTCETLGARSLVQSSSRCSSFSAPFDLDIPRDQMRNALVRKRRKVPLSIMYSKLNTIKRRSFERAMKVRDSFLNKNSSQNNGRSMEPPSVISVREKKHSKKSSSFKQCELTRRVLQQLFHSRSFCLQFHNR